jgi:hypothetical protein
VASRGGEVGWTGSWVRRRRRHGREDGGAGAVVATRSGVGSGEGSWAEGEETSFVWAAAGLI